jgi:hypothetical protein
MPMGHDRETTFSLNWLNMGKLAHNCLTEEMASFSSWPGFANRTVKVIPPIG